MRSRFPESLRADGEPPASGGVEAALVLASRSWVYAAGVLMQSILAYSLLPEGRGAYAVCVTFAYLASVALPLSAEFGAQYFATTRRTSLSKCVVAALGGSLSVGVLAVLFTVPFLQADVPPFNKADASAFALALLLAPLCAGSFALELQLAGHRRFSALAALLAGQSILVVAATVLFVHGFDWGVDGAIMALVVGHAAFFAGCVRELRRRFDLRFELPTAAELRRILGYGLRYHVTRVGSEIEWRIGIVVLALLASREDIGLFAAVSVVALRLNAITTSVGIALFPRVAGAAHDHTEIIGRCQRLALFVTGAALAVVLAVSTPLIRLLLSEAFLPAVPLLWILAPGVLAHSATAMINTYFQAANRPGACSWAVWFGLAANAASMWMLYPSLGIASAAWGYTIGSLVRSTVAAALFHCFSGAPARVIWMPTRDDFAYLRHAGQEVLGKLWKKALKGAISSQPTTVK